MMISDRLIHPVTSFFAHPLIAIQHKNPITRLALLVLWTSVTFLSLTSIYFLSRWYEGRLIKPIDPVEDVEADRVREVAEPILAPLPPPAKKTVADVTYDYIDTLKMELNLRNFLNKVKAEIGFSAIQPEIVEHFAARNPGKVRKDRLEKEYQAWMVETHARGPSIPEEASAANCLKLLSDLKDYRAAPEAIERIRAYLMQVMAKGLDGTTLELLVAHASHFEAILPAALRKEVTDLIHILKLIQEMPPRITTDTFPDFETKIVQISTADLAEKGNDYSKLLLSQIKDAFENIALKATPQGLDLLSLTAIKDYYDLTAVKLGLGPMEILNNTDNDAAAAAALQAEVDEEDARKLATS